MFETSMKIGNVCLIVSWLALVALVAGSSYMYYEASTLPKQSAGSRNVLIDQGKGLRIYGTEREAVIDTIAQRTVIASIAIGIAALGLKSAVKRQSEGVRLKKLT